MKSTLLVLSFVVSALAVTESAPDAGAAGNSVRCQGKKATIVGKPRGTVKGTRRADVIVTNGATFVRTYGGNDLVCVDRVASRNLPVYVYTGKGNDSVVVTTRQKRAVWAELGNGADRFVGGRGPDQVVTGSGPAGLLPVGPDRERDVIDTRGGDDQVWTAGADGTRDTVHLGPGNDLVYLRAPGMRPGALLDGGTGRDRIESGGTYDDDLLDGGLSIDNRTGVGTRDGQPWLRLARLEVFRIGATDSLTFRGNNIAEYLDVRGGYALNADMGGGSDTIGLSPSDRPRTLLGGEGADMLGLRDGGDLVVDASTGTATNITDDQPDKTLTFADFARITAYASNSLVMRGSDDNDDLYGTSCSVTMFGGEGSDHLTLGQVDQIVPFFSCAVGVGHLGGEGGDDTLTGSNGDDTLLGGDGTDRAVGGSGTDTCEAETKASCEL